MKTFKLQLIILVIVLSSQTGLAQETAPAINKFSIGVSASPLMSYRYLRSDGSSPLFEFIVENRNNSEIPKTSYSTGLHFQYHFSRKVGVELGAQFTSMGYTARFDNLVFADGDDPRRYPFLIPIDPNDIAIPNDFELRYNFDYLEIPAKFIFSPGTKKVRFSASAGVITGILLNAWQKNIYRYDGGQESVSTQNQNTTAFRTVVFSPQVSLGATYHVSPKLKIMAEPMIRYSIQTVAESPVKANLYAGGIFIGLYFNL
jgi:hypothetical protein